LEVLVVIEFGVIDCDSEVSGCLDCLGLNNKSDDRSVSILIIGGWHIIRNICILQLATEDRVQGVLSKAAIVQGNVDSTIKKEGLGSGEGLRQTDERASIIVSEFCVLNVGILNNIRVNAIIVNAVFNVDSSLDLWVLYRITITCAKVLVSKFIIAVITEALIR